MQHKRKVVGRRYSRRVQVSPAGFQIDENAYHLLRIPSLKAWALDVLQVHGIAAESLVSRFAAEWTNEGQPLREHVAWTEGVQHDDARLLAARVYELCRYLEIAAAPTTEYEREYCSERVMPWAFELGRISMLAMSYEVDDEATERRRRGASTENSKFTSRDRDRWRETAARLYPTRSKRNAAWLVLRLEGRPETEFESIRRALMKKIG